MTTMDARDLAVELLLATRLGSEEAAALERGLARLDESALRRALRDHDARLAFWIDVYNAVVVRRGVGTFERHWDRVTDFRRTVAVVAGQPLSLDAIEHGILRRSSWKLGLGYLANPRPSPFERAHRVETIDPRIHFALNCGAVSCPPIAAYHHDRIQVELDRATRGYLGAEVTRGEGGIAVPALLLWYAGDFGGARGIRRMLREYGIEGWNRPIRFRPYDWDPDPGRWAPSEEQSKTD
jgi:hypothetical protein